LCITLPTPGKAQRGRMEEASRGDPRPGSSFRGEGTPLVAEIEGGWGEGA